MPNILHCVPCCYDNSYYGPATCIDKEEENQLIHFKLPSDGDFGWKYAIRASDIISMV